MRISNKFYIVIAVVFVVLLFGNVFYVFPSSSKAVELEDHRMWETAESSQSCACPQICDCNAFTEPECPPAIECDSPIIESDVLPPVDFSSLSDESDVPVPAFECEYAFGSYSRPEWFTREEMLLMLPEFYSVFKRRPNSIFVGGGMMFDHGFALYFVAKKLNPPLVIENGVFVGTSTWVLRQALPETPILSLDPGSSAKWSDLFGDDLKNHIIMTNSKFVDFADINWDSKLKELSIPLERKKDILILFDDHQSGLRRMLEASIFGFSHIVFDDNYPLHSGDNWSLRRSCQSVESAMANSGTQAGLIATVDNFNQVKTVITPERHEAMGGVLRALLRQYAEIPPILSPEISKTLRFKKEDASPAIIQVLEDVERCQFGDEIQTMEFLNFIQSSGLQFFNSYTNFLYLEIK